MTKPTTEQALKIARDALKEIEFLYNEGTEAGDMARAALAATAETEQEQFDNWFHSLDAEEILSNRWKEYDLMLLAWNARAQHQQTAAPAEGKP